MKMSKLYIPTSSLNFNNIFSTESISPAVFYKERGYGYSRWTSVPENNMDSVVLLYEHPAMMIRPQSDLEDHPMIIEINTDIAYPVLSDGIRYSAQTIYLDPWNTKIIFLSERDKMIALSMSESSIETKMLRLYQKCICVKSFTGYFPPVGMTDFSVNSQQKEMENDYRLDKMKGLLCGYYIGAGLSASAESVAHISALMEMQSLFSAIMASPSRKPSPFQEECLQETLKTIKRLEPIYRDKNLLEEVDSDRGKLERMVTVLQSRYGLPKSVPDMEQLLRALQGDTDSSNKAVRWLQREMGKVRQTITKERANLSPDSEEIVSSKGELTKISETVLKDTTARELYLSWVNNLLMQRRFNGKLSAVREALSDELTSMAKSVMKEKWTDGNPVREFLNHLRRQVRGESFTSTWNNGLLCSIAAFVMKGDTWGELLNFMQSKGMTDYRIAFSLYGVLNGFANLDRDFTDNLFNQESSYVADVYKEIYGQLYGRDILVDSSFGKEEPSEADAGNLSKPALQVWSEEYVVSEQKGKKAEKLMEGLRLCFGQHPNVTAPELLDRLNKEYADYSWKKKNKPWQGLKEYLSDKTATAASSMPWYSDKSRLQQGELFTTDMMNKQPSSSIEKTSSIFVDDQNAANYLQSLDYLPREIKETLSRKISSFQKDYAAPDGYYFKRPDCPRTNDNTIDHFVRRCTYKKGERPSWIPNTDENKSLLDQLKEDLFARYGNR